MLVNEKCTALKEVCDIFDLTNMVVDPTCFRTPKVEIIYFELSVSECLIDFSFS
jgi:hypothetical protein